MLRSLRLLCVVAAGACLGFFLALFFTWTGVLEYSHSESHYQIVNAPDGSILKVPVYDYTTTISAHSEPYRPAPVVDLFDSKAKP